MIHAVFLSDEQTAELEAIVSKGDAKARETARARILLLSARGLGAPEIADALGVSTQTVYNHRREFCRSGLNTLKDKPRSGKPPKLDGVQRAGITALACSAPPEGHARWSLRLLAGRLVELQVVEGISPETVRAVLKKRAAAPPPAPVVHRESHA